MEDCSIGQSAVVWIRKPNFGSFCCGQPFICQVWRSSGPPELFTFSEYTHHLRYERRQLIMPYTSSFKNLFYKKKCWSRRTAKHVGTLVESKQGNILLPHPKSNCFRKRIRYGCKDRIVLLQTVQDAWNMENIIHSWDNRFYVQKKKKYMNEFS